MQLTLEVNEATCSIKHGPNKSYGEVVIQGVGSLAFAQKLTSTMRSAMKAHPEIKGWLIDISNSVPPEADERKVLADFILHNPNHYFSLYGGPKLVSSVARMIIHILHRNNVQYYATKGQALRWLEKKIG